MKLKIKDKTFELINISNVELLYLLQETNSVSKDGIINCPSNVINFKFVYKYIQDKKQFKEYYLYLVNKKKEENSTLLDNYKYLYKFQKEAIIKIVNSKYNGFILSLQQGLGKTLVSLIVSHVKKEENIWIVIPASLLEQWEEEINKWLGDNDIQIYKGDKLKRNKMYKSLHEYNIISYETLRNDYENINLRKNITNSFMIMDESTKLKNKRTKLYKLFKKICLKNKFNLFLTGTPITNGLEDMDNVIKLIDKKLTNIENHTIYEEVTVGWGINARRFFELVGYKNLPEYIEIIKPVYFRKSKEEAAPFLPKKNIITINVPQTSAHHKIKNAIISEMSMFQGFTLLQTLECGYEVISQSKSENAEIIIEDYNKYIKVLDKIPKAVANPKLNILKDLLEEVNDNVLIFSRFKSSCSNIALFLEKQFPNKKIAIVTSETKNKNEIAEKFRNKEIDFVIATDTWARGISFPNIDYLINFDISASYEIYFQKQDRIHRLNSTTPKFIYNLVGDVIENYIMDLLLSKTKLTEQITEGKAGIISESNIKKEVAKKLGWKY